MRNKRGSEVLSSIQQPCRSGWRTGGALGGSVHHPRGDAGQVGSWLSVVPAHAKPHCAGCDALAAVPSIKVMPQDQPDGGTRRC